jgi:hypothetical protein
MMKILEVKKASQKNREEDTQQKLLQTGFGESPCGFGSSMG